MQIGGEGAKLAHTHTVASLGHGDKMRGAPDINGGRIQVDLLQLGREVGGADTTTRHSAVSFHTAKGTLQERRWRDRHSPKRDRKRVTTDSTATPPRPDFWTG